MQEFVRPIQTEQAAPPIAREAELGVDRARANCAAEINRAATVGEAYAALCEFLYQLNDAGVETSGFDNDILKVLDMRLSVLIQTDADYTAARTQVPIGLEGHFNRWSTMRREGRQTKAGQLVRLYEMATNAAAGQPNEYEAIQTALTHALMEILPVDTTVLELACGQMQAETADALRRFAAWHAGQQPAQA